MSNYNNSVSNLIKSLKCVKCGSKKSLESYNCSKKTVIKSTRRYTRYKIETTLVPVCTSCRTEFQKWHKLREISKCTEMFGGTLLIITIALIFYSVSLKQNINIWIISSAVFSAMFIIVTIVNVIPTLRMEANPFHYMKNKGNGNVFIKPLGSQNWIEYRKWIGSVLEN